MRQKRRRRLLRRWRWQCDLGEGQIGTLDYWGRRYEGGFMAAYEKIDVGIPYDGPEALLFNE